MKIKPHVSLTLAAQITPQEDTAQGAFNLGTALQNITIPEDADQMLAITFELDEAGSEADKPSALYIEPATGQAEEDLSNLPAGWSATEFNAWAVLEKFGTTVPAIDTDGADMDLTAVYALAINATAPVEISAAANSGAAWTDLLGTGAAVTMRDLLTTTPAGAAVAADEQIRIENKHAGSNTVTLVVLGKR